MVIAVVTASGSGAAATPSARAEPTSVQHVAAPPLVVVPLGSPAKAAPPAWLAASARRRPASAGNGDITLTSQLLGAVRTTDVPRVALAAYMQASAGSPPTCALRWEVLAGIGFIESGHARGGGSASPHWSGVARPHILGPVLDGAGGFGVIHDTDGGRLDGNRQWDRAVGPMQFLPSTWASYGVAVHGSRFADPENIYDAAAAAARYLCVAGGTLGTTQGLIGALYAYNHSFAYVQSVLSVAMRYADGKLPAGAGALASLPALASEGGTAPTATRSPWPAPARHPQRQPTAAPDVTYSANARPPAGSTPSEPATPSPSDSPSDSPSESPTTASPTTASPTTGPTP
jgi:hypothetical protein